MKSSLLLLPLILLSLSLIALPTQAVKPEVIEAETIITETPIEPGGGIPIPVILTMLEHANNVVKLNGEYAHLTTTLHMVQRLVDTEGNLLAVVNIQVTYSGTVLSSDMSFYTGTVTLKWQVIILEGGEWVSDLVPIPEPQGARSVRFVNGNIVHEGGFGDYSWFGA